MKTRSKHTKLLVVTFFKFSVEEYFFLLSLLSFPELKKNVYDRKQFLSWENHASVNLSCTIDLHWLKYFPEISNNFWSLYLWPLVQYATSSSWFWEFRRYLNKLCLQSILVYAWISITFNCSIIHHMCAHPCGIDWYTHTESEGSWVGERRTDD